MKKLYKKSTVHPTPPIILYHLSFLPATILTLTASLSYEDKQVLAYLLSISSSKNHFKNHNNVFHKPIDDHQASFDCCYFRCYMSYWVRWDSSPNRQLIHEIIDAFEEGLSLKISKKDKGKKGKRKGRNGNVLSELKGDELSQDELGESEAVVDGCDSGGGGVVEEVEKGSVRRLVSFLGEKIFGGFGISDNF